MNDTPTTPTTGAVKVDAERIKALRDQYLDTPLSIDIKESAERHGIANPPQMTVATTNGKLCGCFGTQLNTSRDLCLTRLVVSEPLVDLPGA
jgi:hypothetical protein